MWELGLVSDMQACTPRLEIRSHGLAVVCASRSAFESLPVTSWGLLFVHFPPDRLPADTKMGVASMEGVNSYSMLQMALSEEQSRDIKLPQGF
jgi:hypothetical protein